MGKEHNYPQEERRPDLTPEEIEISNRLLHGISVDLSKPLTRRDLLKRAAVVAGGVAGVALFHKPVENIFRHEAIEQPMSLADIITGKRPVVGLYSEPITLDLLNSEVVDGDENEVVIGKGKMLLNHRVIDSANIISIKNAPIVYMGSELKPMVKVTHVPCYSGKSTEEYVPNIAYIGFPEKPAGSQSAYNGDLLRRLTIQNGVALVQDKSSRYHLIDIVNVGRVDILNSEDFVTPITVPTPSQSNDIS